MEHHDYSAPSIVDLGPTEGMILGDGGFKGETVYPFELPESLVTEFDEE